MDTGELCSDITANFQSFRESTITAINQNMLRTLWRTGKMISDFCESNPESDDCIKQLAKELGGSMGTAFSEETLHDMLMFYRRFSTYKVLSDSLSWSHYKLLSEIEDKNERKFYIIESASNRWSVEELGKRIRGGYYRALNSHPNTAAFRKKMQKEIEPASSQDLADISNALEFFDL